MALFTLPAGDGRDAIDTTGTALGTIVNVMAKSLLLPTRLAARSVVLTMPLTVGVPLMTPVLVLRPKPVGKAVTSE